MSTGRNAMDILTRFAPEMSQADLQHIGACSVISQNTVKPIIQRVCASSEIMLSKKTKFRGPQLRVLAMTAVVHSLVRLLQGMLAALQHENFAAATLLRTEVIDILQTER